MSVVVCACKWSSFKIYCIKTQATGQGLIEYVAETARFVRMDQLFGGSRPRVACLFAISRLCESKT